jgi:hypothetical protein
MMEAVYVTNVLVYISDAAVYQNLHSCVRQYLTVYSFNIPARLRSVMEKETLQKLVLEST